MMGPSTVVIAVVIITARQLSGRLLSASINEYLCVSAKVTGGGVCLGVG